MEKKLISESRKKRFEVQGITGFSIETLSELKYGIRFAFQLCVSLVLIGLLTKSYILLIAMNLVAIGGSIFSRHPFDYLFNHILSPLIKKPAVPQRSPQLRFACIMASFSLAGIISLFYLQMDTAAYLLGASLVLVGGLVSTTDICIPSHIYNALFLKSKSPKAVKSGNLF
ncbi:MAG: DUF4395 family protein [Bacteroidia bacterium]|nr:DUF4395 family protein [Bacteroidia bacterium]